MQEFPTLLPRQNEAYGKLLQAKPGSYTILGYGGGMGGGKSIYLATIAVQFALSYPGTRILMARDELSALKDSTMRDFFSFLPQQFILKYNQSENWVRIRRDTWPEGVFSTVLFRGIHDYQQKGSEAYQIILIDEASEVSAEAARYLLSRLRWKLPKTVQRVLATQCRHVAAGQNGLWFPCGRKVLDGECPEHGSGWVSSDVPYFFVATSNPWPGWFTDWFHKKELDVVLESLGNIEGISVHFVQSLMRDNVHLPSNYEALNTMGFTPEERRRFVDGEFGVFSGLIYEAFDKRTHAWYGPIPAYKRVLGGLDFGQESSTAHYTAGVIVLLTENNRLILVDEFKERGPRVYERQGEWMIAMEQKWGAPIKKRIEWRGDRSQALGIASMRKNGFVISLSKGGRDSVDAGIKNFAVFLNKRPDGYPGFFYLPDGHEMGRCPEFEREIKEYVRDPVTRAVVEINDDILDSLRYTVEGISGITGDPNKLFRNAVPAMV